MRVREGGRKAARNKGQQPILYMDHSRGNTPWHGDRHILTMSRRELAEEREGGRKVVATILLANPGKDGIPASPRFYA